MKNIDNYITEKLFIGRGFSVKHIFNVRDYIFTITVLEHDDSYDVNFWTPAVCKSINGDKLKYKHVDDYTYKEEGLMVSAKVFVNDKGYYEGMDENDKEVLILYMNVEDGLMFLDEWKRYDIEKLKTLLIKYFDSKDEFLKSKDIKFNNDEHPDFKHLYNAYAKAPKREEE